jgi:hypothetical protein
MSRALVIAIVLLASCSTPAAVGSPSVSTPTATALASVTPTRTAQPTPTTAPSATPSPTPSLLPIFDAHLHYSRESWTKYPPERVLAMLDTLGVRGALVSSAPDEGTFRLRALLGERITPMLGPYRSGQDVFSWTRDGTVLPYLESAYRPGIHKGFGEFHLNAGQVGLPVVQSALAFAASRNLFLQVHADSRATAELLNAVGPGYVVLWAHAGVTATPEQVDALMAQWPKLWTELSLRDDVAPNGQLDSRWRALFVKYPDRFLVGTDTWTVGGTFTGNERWDAYAEIVRGIRAWLAQLPPDLAGKIAHLNAERLLALFP